MHSGLYFSYLSILDSTLLSHFVSKRCICGLLTTGGVCCRLLLSVALGLVRAACLRFSSNSTRI